MILLKIIQNLMKNNMAMIKQLEEMIPSEDEKFLGSDPRVMMKFYCVFKRKLW